LEDCYKHPDDFWLGGKPGCSDSNKDYSRYTNFEFTHPVACGEYGKAFEKSLKDKYPCLEIICMGHPATFECLKPV